MEKIIQVLIKEALKALSKDEVPVGCVITKNGKIISRAHNTKENKHLCINHAEILAIKKASKKIKDWRLEDCELYVTLEPCQMCMEAIKQSRIKKIYYLLESHFNNENHLSVDKKLINADDPQKYYQNLLKAYFVSKR